MDKQYTFQGINSANLLIVTFALLLICTSCKKEKNDPVIETNSITGLSVREYTATATIVDRGDYKIIDHGFIYTFASQVNQIGSYSTIKVSLGDTIENSTFGTTFDIGENYSSYYANLKCYTRAYLTNEKGTVYGKYVSTDLLAFKLTSIVPSTGSLGDTVTINGNLFNTTPSFNQVYFENTSAQVVSGTSTTLRVIVPLNISNYYYDDYLSVMVRVDGKELTLQDAFRLKTSVVSFAPYSGSWDTYITINGAGLYNASLYFDEFFVTSNQNYSTSIQASIPYNIGKKKFKLFVHKNGEILEVPGGYFILNDFVVNPLYTTTYQPGADIYFSGQMFNPQNSMNKLILGNVTMTAYSGYSSSAYFAIPNSMPTGTYQPRLTNGIDTVQLMDQNINIVN